ncbi:hypothetical protein AVEN_66963-1 [Araneus ventricosus]|uniref:Uncharacterized protein n=1 Tax=Araneus ventricosus TaxID=182803 RepID=A0A4Y2QE74_ARAVE|nr:hypothetical protein AVEN_66963-1 [Araneus ventricosus]
MDKTVQSENNRMKEEFIQTEDFLITAIKNEETEKSSEIECSVSPVPKTDKIAQTQIYMKKAEFSQTHEKSTTALNSETISPILPLPKTGTFGIQSTKSSHKGIKISSRKHSFLIPKDPNLFVNNEMSTQGDKVAEAYLKYIEDKHKEKKLSFFQRKMAKFRKRFKKN